MSAISTNNSTTNTSAQSDQTSQSGQVVMMVFFWLIIIVGIAGNSLVIIVVKMIRSMRTTTNYLLLNVAASDITTLLFTAIHVISGMNPTSSPPLRDFLCKFIDNNTIVIVTLLVTTMTMMLLAFERYHALVKPLVNSHRLTNGNIAYVITAIWVVAIAMVTPLFASFSIQQQGVCLLGAASNKMVVYISCVFVVLTVIPFTVIAFCYSQIVYGLYFKKTICNNNGERADTPEETREKRRLVALLILLTVVFFMAFIPYGLLIILKFNNIIANINMLHLQYSAQYLTLFNCSVNPFIYAFQSSNYRRSFAFVFKKMCCRNTTVDALEILELRTRTSLRSV